jgi:hypothetical protein
VVLDQDFQRSKHDRQRRSLALGLMGQSTLKLLLSNAVRRQRCREGSGLARGQTSSIVWRAVDGAESGTKRTMSLDMGRPSRDTERDARRARAKSPSGRGRASLARPQMLSPLRRVGTQGDAFFLPIPSIGLAADAWGNL